MAPTDERPIGVFDSGVGGLTVLRALRARLPQERTVYLGDTARVPYGTKSAEVVVRYALKNAAFLLGRDIKLLVVACNTASSVAIPSLQAALPIPVVGVIEPGAAAAVRMSRSGRVGVLGTPGTIASGAYQRALQRLWPEIYVWARACPLWVPLAEEGWTDGEVPQRVTERYLEGIVDARVDTLVLGCTHYPLLRAVIAQAAGPRVELVDSGEATAEVVEQLLREGKVGAASPGEAPEAAASPVAGLAEYFVTDVPASFNGIAQRFLGMPVPHVEQIDLPV